MNAPASFYTFVLPFAVFALTILTIAVKMLAQEIRYIFKTPHNRKYN